MIMLSKMNLMSDRTLKVCRDSHEVREVLSIKFSGPGKYKIVALLIILLFVRVQLRTP